MKFFADAMLGRLATWMRILGCDVRYRPQIEDGDLVEQARRDGRIILTRDTRLVLRRYARDHSFLVIGDDYKEQLRKVTDHFGLRARGRFLSRCLRCNTELLHAEPEEVRNGVPVYVWQARKSFARCPHCRRIYWDGTHRDSMKSQLDRILEPQGEAIDSAKQ